MSYKKRVKLEYIPIDSASAIYIIVDYELLEIIDQLLDSKTALTDSEDMNLLADKVLLQEFICDVRGLDNV